MLADYTVYCGWSTANNQGTLLLTV